MMLQPFSVLLLCAITFSGDLLGVVDGFHVTVKEGTEEETLTYVTTHGYQCQPEEINLETQVPEPARSSCKELLRLVKQTYGQVNRCDCLRGFESGVAEKLNCYWAEADTWVYNDWIACSAPGQAQVEFASRQATKSTIMPAAIELSRGSSDSVQIALSMILMGGVYWLTPRWWMVRFVDFSTNFRFILIFFLNRFVVCALGCFSFLCTDKRTNLVCYDSSDGGNFLLLHLFIEYQAENELLGKSTFLIGG